MARKAAAKAAKKFVSHRTSEEVLLTFGNLIRAKRRSTGVTGSGLARMIGLSQSSLARIELGEREPHLDVIRKLHKILNLKDEVLKYLEKGKF